MYEPNALDRFPIVHDERLLVILTMRACETSTLTRTQIHAYLQWARARGDMLAHVVEEARKQELVAEGV